MHLLIIRIKGDIIHLKRLASSPAALRTVALRMAGLIIFLMSLNATQLLSSLDSSRNLNLKKKMNSTASDILVSGSGSIHDASLERVLSS
jgi:hypothetical protein